MLKQKAREKKAYVEGAFTTYWFGAVLIKYSGFASIDVFALAGVSSVIQTLVWNKQVDQLSDYVIMDF